MCSFIFIHCRENVLVECDSFSDEESAVLAAFKRARDLVNVFDFDSVEVWSGSDRLLTMNF